MKTEGFLVLLGLLGGLAQVSETNVVPLEAAFQGKLHFLDFKVSFSFMLTSHASYICSILGKVLPKPTFSIFG